MNPLDPTDVIARQLHATARTSRRNAGDPAAVLAPHSAAIGSADAADWPWLQAAIDMAWRSCGYPPAAQDGASGAWATLPRVATRSPAPVTTSIATARAFTLRTMRKWGAEPRGDDAAAVVTELMTNALRHALPQLPGDEAAESAWPIRLGLADPGPYVICAIADPSSKLPALRQPDWQDEAGRGLLVVASLSDEWGCCSAPDGQGKVVWAAFAVASREPGQAG